MGNENDAQIIANIITRTKETERDAPTDDVAIGALISQLSPEAVLDGVTGVIEAFKRNQTFHFSVLKLYFRQLTEALVLNLDFDEIAKIMGNIQGNFMDFYNEFSNYYDALDVPANMRQYDTISWNIFKSTPMRHFLPFFQIPNLDDVMDKVNVRLDAIDETLNQYYYDIRDTSRLYNLTDTPVY